MDQHQLQSPVAAPDHHEEIAANYLWWQKNGAFWVERYPTNKRQTPKYHISEFILCEYVAQHAPARVLEFGCGTGRHLRYLRDIPGVEVFGIDQSPTMVEGIRRWADPEWLGSHVAVGAPLGPLPYEDGSFDLVFTASVLVHVRPEDLPGILRELARVSRGHVLHVENRIGWREPYTPDHDGCWTHDLPAAYAALGWEYGDISGGDPTPALFRALAPGCAAGYTPSPQLLGLYEGMVRSLMGPRTPPRYA